jgi:protoporphyrinogen oxidase
VVEHTNFISASHYHADSLLYVGNYLAADHHFFSLSAEELIDEFAPHLKKINPAFNKSQISKSWVWKTPFAQPIFTPGSGRTIPRLRTPVPGLFLAGTGELITR